MLILFGGDRNRLPRRTDTPPTRRCEFVDDIAPYIARQIEPQVRAAFEQHLIDCEHCRRAVHLGRISIPLKHHNRSVGMPCAAQTRRKP